MSEVREIFFFPAMETAALDHARECIQDRERDFITVTQRICGWVGLSLYDVRYQAEGWYNTVRDELAAGGGDLAGTTPPAETAEAARWLCQWLSHRTYLDSRYPDNQPAWWTDHPGL